MKTLHKLFGVGMLAMAAASASADPIFVGQWDLFGGESWATATAPVLTGQEAAALLYGGLASDYLISTNGDDAANINFSAWYDRYGYGPIIDAQDYKVDTGILGVYDTWGDRSARIQDNAGGQNLMNFAFRVQGPSADVPEPLTGGLLGVGLLGMALARRRKPK